MPIGGYPIRNIKCRAICLPIMAIKFGIGNWRDEFVLEKVIAMSREVKRAPVGFD